jgi:hypothetical protein
MGKTSDGVLAITSLESIIQVRALAYSIKPKVTKKLRSTAALIYTRLSKMQKDSSYIAGILSRRRLFKYIALLLSSRQR